MIRRISVLVMVAVLLMAGICHGAESIKLSEVNSTNYDRYIKDVRDAYGYNKGECSRAYLPHEEYYYGRTYDHWNVDRVYDSNEIKKLFLDFEKSKGRIEYAENAREGMCIGWTSIRNADKYELYRRSGNGSWKLIVCTDEIVYLDKGASVNGRTYQYRVRGIKTVKSRRVYTSYSKAKDSLRLLSPIVISAKSTGNREIRTSWLMNMHADGYQVRCVSSRVSRTKNVDGKNNVSAVIGGLTRGTVYSVYVRCVKSGRYSAWSREYVVRVK